MDATTWTRLASACLGKQAFSTPQLASKVQRRRAQSRGRKRHTYKVKQHVYHCKACGLFHIGTKTKSVHAAAKRAAQRNHGDSADMA